MTIDDRMHGHDIGLALQYVTGSEKKAMLAIEQRLHRQDTGWALQYVTGSEGKVILMMEYYESK